MGKILPIPTPKKKLVEVSGQIIETKKTSTNPSSSFVIHVVHHHVYDNVTESIPTPKKKGSEWAFLKSPFIWLFMLTALSMIFGRL